MTHTVIPYVNFIDFRARWKNSNDKKGEKNIQKVFQKPIIQTIIYKYIFLSHSKAFNKFKTRFLG